MKSGIVEDYPPLVDKKGSYSAQFEHVSIAFVMLLLLVIPTNEL